MYYMDSHEYIIFARKGKAKKINNNGSASILRHKNIKTKINGKNIHDTEKPIELMKVLIGNSSSIGDIVMDPFMGSGTTGIAAIELDRNFIGIELDEGYFKIAQTRIQAASNKEEKHE